MPYIGRELDRGNYLKLDDISSSFDGSTTTFNLTNGGNAFYPGSAFSILVVLAGVVQEPEAAYQINQAQITFASAPLAGDQFFCITLGVALGVNTPANGSVNGAQLAKPFNYDNYFYLDDANNRVGVGTATPMTPLHVEGTGRFTDLTVTGDLTVEGTTTTLDTVVTEVDKLEVGANNNTVGVAITQSGTGDILNLYDGGTEVFSVTDGGKVSIGSGAWPGAQGLYLGDAGHIYSVGTNSLYTNQNLYYNSGWKYNGNSAGTQLSMVGGVFSFSNAPVNSSGAGAAATLTERLRIDASGNVLIKNDTLAYFNLTKNNGGGNGSLSYNGTIFAITSNSVSADMQLGTNSTPRLTIKSGGNIGIGTDTISDNLEVFAPTNASLQIKGGAAGSDASRSAQLKLLASGSKLYVMEADATDGSFRILDSSTERLRIKSDGNVGIKNTSPNNTLTVGDTIQPSYTPASAGNYIEIARTSGGDAGLLINKNTGQWLIGIDNSDGANAPLRFEYGAAGSAHPGFGAGTLGMFMKHDGNIGIGTDSPAVIAGMSKYLTLSSKTVNHAVGFELQGNRTGTDQTVGRISFINNANEIARINVDSASGGTNGNLTVITSGTERIRVNADGKVGVGTDSLGHKFTVYGPNTIAKFQSSTSYVDLMFQNTGATNGFIQYNNAGNFKFYANSGSTPTLTISSGAPGNVGIGEDTPDVRLHVKEQFDTAYSLTSVTTDTNHLLKLENPSTTANAFAGMQFRVGSGADLYFGAIQQSINHGDFFFANQNSPQREMMRIKSSGLVGIGTDNPDTQLHVFGSSTTGQLKIGGGNSAGNHRVYINCHETDSYIDSYGNNAYGKLRINAAPLLLNESGGGNVGIGTNNADKKLRVEGDARITGTLTIGEASTVIDGSVEYPTIRPTLDLNFAGTKVLDDRITFTRDSIATYTDENGLVKYASNNVPRFDHDPTTHESLGLLIEGSRTNIAPYGNDMSQYSSVNITKTANDAVAPDGTTTATKLQHGGGGSNWYLDYSPGGTNASGAGTYTYSVWVKAPDDQPDDYYGCKIAILTTTGNNTEAVFSLAKTWRRISITKTYASESGTIRIHPIIFRNTPGNTDSGKVIPSYVWVWGSQWEQGSFPTSYIPTSGSTVTRDVDNFKISGTNFDSFINKSEGTMMMEYKNISSSVSTGLPTIGDGTHSRYMMFNLSSDNGFSAATVNGGVVQANPSISVTSSSTEFVKAIYAVKENDFALTANGQTPVTDTSGTVFTTPTQFTLEYGTGGNDPNAHFKSIKYYPKRLPNAQLQGLTQQ